MRKSFVGVAAIGVLAFCVVASAAPQNGYTLPPELQGRASVVYLPTPAAPAAAGELRPGLQGKVDAEMPLNPDIAYRVISDEAVARGESAAGGAGKALIWLDENAPPATYGYFLDGSPGTLQATRMIFANGWQSGKSLAGWDAMIFVSSANFGAFNGTGSFYMELWDGDPMAAFDTTCSTGGVPAPIAGTGCTFTDLPEATVYMLECTFPAKVQWNCDRVFGVIFPYPVGAEPGHVCRWSWRLACGAGVPGCGILPPNIGQGDGMESVWACEQFTSSGVAFCGNAPSGLNIGNCCSSGEACDHSGRCTSSVCVGGPLAGAACTNNFGCYVPAGGCNAGGGAHAAACDDPIGSESADYFFASYDLAPAYYYDFLGAAYAASDVVAKVVPRNVDAPVGAAVPSYATISGNTVTIDKGGACVPHYVMLELTMPDWDPAATGLKLKAYEAGIDSTGYTAGLRGTMTPYQATCAGDGDCSALFGPIGAGAAKGGCGVPGVPAGKCAAGWINESKPGFILGANAFLGGVDQSTLDYRYGATLLGLPISSPHIGDMYAGTLALLTVDDQHAGTFYVDLKPPPRTNMVDQNSQFIALLGVLGAEVDFPLGQCCNISVDPTVCVSDEVTRCECYELGVAGGFNVNFDPTKTCADDCIQCLPGDHAACGDADACTVNRCVDMFCQTTPKIVPAASCCNPTATKGSAADIDGLGAIASNNDGDQCTDDLCNPGTGCAVEPYCGVPANPPSAAGTACDDDNQCTYADVCDGLVPPTCAGLDVNDVECVTSDDCERVTGVAFDCVGGYCLCVLEPPLTFEIHPSQKPNGNCFLVGETILVDVFMGAAANVITGGQFVVDYDPACLSFNSISPGGDPYVYEIAEIVDEGAGMIFYAVGVDPFGGVGANGNKVLAQISFTKIGVCETCNLCFGGLNPMNTYLVDDTGQRVGVAPECSKDILENDHLTFIDIPDDVVTNVDCNAVTAIVDWDAPVADSSCYEAALVCTGVYPNGAPIPQPVIMAGGEFPIGVSTICCTATSTVCGDSIEDCWTVTVNDETTLDVTLQVSPIIAAAEMERCFKFELYWDCVQPPVIIEQDLTLGGMWDHVGHFTDQIKLPGAGQYMCITARDQLHTLRACADVVAGNFWCVDGVYYAVFKGDPFFGGNWLIGGNLDGWKKDNPNASHDVIDILDFGQFVANYAAQYGTSDTPCPTVGPNADINGDGVVDALDFTFVTMNFLASSKECCCGGITAAAPRTEVSLRELRAMGLGDLAVADLNGDGVLNTDDMSAFSNGVRPSTKADRKSGLR